MSDTKLLAWSEYQEAILWEARRLERQGYTVTMQLEHGSCETDRHIERIFTVRDAKTSNT